MLVDCQTCPVRDVHCADCMVTALTGIPLFSAEGPSAVLAGAPPGSDQQGRMDADAPSVPLDRAERRAVSTLLAAGLVTTSTANGARATLDPVTPVLVPRSGARRRAV